MAADAASRALVRWLERCGGECNVSLRTVCSTTDPTTSDRAAAAPRGGLRAGDLVARVPDACVLLASTSAAGPLLEAAGLLRHPSDPWRDSIALALALITERARGGASPWAPYVRWLYSGPGMGHHPAHWTRSDIKAALGGTAAARRLLRRARHAPGAVDAAAAALAVPWLRAVGLAHDDASARADFKAALAIVASYAFNLGDASILALVPIFDALNTRPGRPRVRLGHVEGGNACGHDHDHDSGCGGGHLTMHSTVCVAPTAPVWNSYGRLASGELLRRYGIAPPKAGRPTVDDTLDFTPAAVAAAAVAVAGRSHPAPTTRARRAAAAAAAAGGGLRSYRSGAPSRALLAAAAAAGGGARHAKRVLVQTARDRLAAVTRRRPTTTNKHAMRAGARVRAIEAELARRLEAWVERVLMV